MVNQSTDLSEEGTEDPSLMPNGWRIVNLTSAPITVWLGRDNTLTRTIPPSGLVATALSQTIQVDTIGGVPLFQDLPAGMANVPEAADRTVYVADPDVVTVLRRKDIYMLMDPYTFEKIFPLSGGKIAEGVLFAP